MLANPNCFPIWISCSYTRITNIISELKSTLLMILINTISIHTMSRILCNLRKIYFETSHYEGNSFLLTYYISVILYPKYTWLLKLSSPQLPEWSVLYGCEIFRDFIGAYIQDVVYVLKICSAYYPFILKTISIILALPTNHIFSPLFNEFEM